MSSDEERNLSVDEDDLLPAESDVELVEEHETAAEPAEQNVEVFEGANNEDDQPNPNQAEKNEEDNKKETKVKRVRNPQPKLDVERLRGPRGIRILEKVFQDVKFKGRGHEEENLTLLMKHYEYWCHRMFPKLPFDDCLERMEKLGHKRYLQTFLKRIRMNMENDEIVQENLDEVVDRDLSDEENNAFNDLLPPHTSQPNNFGSDSLTEEQLQRIAINRERAQRLRRQMLTKNKVADESATVSSTGHSSEGNEYNSILSQDSNNCNGSNNIHITNNSSQFIVEIEIHATDDNVSENTDLNTVEVNEPNIALSQISDICDTEESISSACNSSELVIVPTNNSRHSCNGDEVCEDVDMNDIEIDKTEVNDQHANESETVKKLPSECNRNEVSERSTILDEKSQENEALQQSHDEELNEDILAAFMNEEFDDIVTKNVNQKDSLKKSDTGQFQKEDTSRNEDSLAMDIDT